MSTGYADMQWHEAATLFPLMTDRELAELAEDLRKNGLRTPIVLLGGKILDGRNRHRACQLAGIDPAFDYVTTLQVGDPFTFVASLNLHRRHLDESQRGMVGARLKAHYASEAKERQRGGQGGVLLPRNSAEAKGEAREKAAVAVNVSKDTIDAASKVLEKGVPALVEAVERGEVAVSTAAVVAAELTAPAQAELVAKGEREILAAAKEIRAKKQEERREERTAKLVEIARGNTELTGGIGTFPVLLADPPWRYDFAETDARVIENQYPTLDLPAICALPVADLCTPDAVLFLWGTSPKLPEAFRVLEAWGFTYRTCMVWVKDKIGMGYYARQQHELLLIATRGAPPTPAPADRPPSVVHATRGEHSAKPAEFYALIERMYPTLPKLELFCRAPRAGWTTWGNQAGGCAA